MSQAAVIESAKDQKEDSQKKTFNFSHNGKVLDG